MLRYARQELIDGWDPHATRDASVLLFGAGTTGNETLKNLTLAGFGYTEVLDLDVVEEVNLGRCVLLRQEDVGLAKAEAVSARARELNPHVTIVGRQLDLIHDFGALEYRRFHLAILTVDNLEARLWANRYCMAAGIPLIDTGIGGLRGNVMLTVPPDGACIECDWMAAEYARIAERRSCSNVGLEVDDPKIAMIVTTAAIVAGYATQIALGLRNPRLVDANAYSGALVFYDGRSGTLERYRNVRNPACPGHAAGPPRETVLLPVSLDDEVSAVKQCLRERLGGTEVQLWHDKEIVYTVVCRTCARCEVIAPRALGRFKRLACSACPGTMVPHTVSEELRDGYRLRELDLPSRHWLRADAEVAGVVERVWLATE